MIGNIRQLKDTQKKTGLKPLWRLHITLKQNVSNSQPASVHPAIDSCGEKV